ncbi:hypothetical protein D3C76_1627450 [compost metagenome]
MNLPGERGFDGVGQVQILQIRFVLLLGRLVLALERLDLLLQVLAGAGSLAQLLDLLIPISNILLSLLFCFAEIVILLLRNKELRQFLVDVANGFVQLGFLDTQLF